MQDITDETLSAYLDHELDAVRRADVEAEIARNPALARRLAALREADALTREAFAEVSAQPVPESLLQAASGAATTRRRPARPRLRLPRLPRLLPTAPMPALAMGLVAGIALTVVVQLPQLLGGTDTPPTASPLQPAAQLAKALATTPSNKLFSSASLTVVPLNTFRTASGQVCREYQARAGAQGSAMAGIACRNGAAGWHNEIVVSLGSTGQNGFTPAAADDGLMAMRPQWQQAEVLDQSEERALLQQWAAKNQ